MSSFAAVNQSPLHLFEADHNGARRQVATLEPDTARKSRGGKLNCGCCGGPVTDAAWRISVAGGHEHTRCNPHGFVFHIGCFSEAAGCRIDGQPTAEHSWFAGREWQFALCARCKTHLGWAYRSGANLQFFGLILTRLTGSS